MDRVFVRMDHVTIKETEHSEESVKTILKSKCKEDEIDSQMEKLKNGARLMFSFCSFYEKTEW